MKKLIVLIVFLQVVSIVSAQNLTISFQPKVNNTPIDSILATNLSTNQNVKLSGGESIVLVKTATGINPVLVIFETGYIYPNPSNEDATLCYSMNKSEEVEIGMYNTNGQLLKQNRLFLEQGTHRFEIKFPVAGIYFLSVLKSEGTASFKAVYTGSKTQNTSIQYTGSEKLVVHNRDANQLKQATTGKTLNYTDGDFIHYSVFSGVNTTIITETPTVSKAFEVEFVKCIDKDNKSYKAVKIGNQWWMAENLAYLPSVSPPSEGSATSPYYYVYDYSGTNVTSAKLAANYSTYGVLYNWLASLAVCPPGWHLPSDAEWIALSDYLGGKEVSGGKMKENGTTHWTSPNEGATNESGFSSLPAGHRDKEGAFSAFGNHEIWWSSTEYNDNKNYVWSWWNSYFYDNGYSYMTLKEYGYSVRCVRD
jgi:uncharacterized protein (TIGR02145 family)